MADTVLTKDQLENIFYTLICQLLGLDPEAETSFSKVRISWPKGGAPAWGINEDIAFLQILPLDGPITRQIENTYSPLTDDALTVSKSYTRVHLLTITLYGPNSFDNADIIRQGLFDANLSANNLYIVLDIPAVRSFPDKFNGQWWSRSDLSVRFYERVIRQSTVPVISGVNIKIITEEGVTRDANITD